MTQEDFRRREYVDACITKARYEAECYFDQQAPSVTGQAGEPPSGDKTLAAAPSPDDGGLMTAEEVAALFKKSPQTISRWRREGKLRGTKANGRWMFRRKTVERALRDGVE